MYLLKLKFLSTYRDEIYPLQNLLSRTQAEPGRTVKKEQEEISPNHVQRINLISVYKVRELVSTSKLRRLNFISAHNLRVLSVLMVE